MLDALHAAWVDIGDSLSRSLIVSSIERLDIGAMGLKNWFLGASEDLC